MCVLHSFYKSTSKDTKIVFYNLKTGKTKVLLPECITSHHCYISETELLICIIKNNQTSFILYDLEDFSYRLVLDNYNIDGHPSYIDTLIFLDTYPTRLGLQHLLISRSLDMRPEKFFSIYSPRRLNSGPLRVDLHPRIDVHNRLVWIDVLVKGYRQLWGLDISELLSYNSKIP